MGSGTTAIAAQKLN
ncbi:hypothetical protein [Candidatus Rickettsia kedanie]